MQPQLRPPPGPQLPAAPAGACTWGRRCGYPPTAPTTLPARLPQIMAALDMMRAALRGAHPGFSLQQPSAAVCKFSVHRSLLVRLTGRNGGTAQGIRAKTGAGLEVEAEGGGAQRCRRACRRRLALPSAPAPASGSGSMLASRLRPALRCRAAALRCQRCRGAARGG
jgi:hypothetical protein